MKKTVLLFSAFLLIQPSTSWSALSAADLGADAGDRWIITGVKREVLEDATFYDPVTEISGPIEGGMALPSYCVVCLSSKGEIELGKKFDQPDKVTQKGAVVDTLKKIAEGAGAAEYAQTRIWVTKGYVEIQNRLVVNGKEILVGGHTLEGNKNGPDGSKIPNESIITPCGYAANRFLPDPCPNRFEETRDHIKRKMPKPAELRALDVQTAEKDTVI